MKINQASVEELKRICAESFAKVISDEEAQEIGQRIIRFIVNSDVLAHSAVL